MAALIGRELIRRLKEAGIADEMTTRVIIDIPVNRPVRIYVEKVGDTHLLDVLPAIINHPHEVVREEKIDPNQIKINRKGS